MTNARGHGSPATTDLALELLPGDQLHRLFSTARSTGRLATSTIFGVPALLLTGYEDIRAFFGDQEQFPGGPVYRFQVEPAVGRTFISMDGEEHDLYRQLATPAFRSRATTAFVDTELVPLAHEVIDRFVDKGEVDLVEELTGVLPFWAISRKLGLPVGTEDRQRSWALSLLSYPATPDTALAAAAEVTKFLQPHVEERRRQPSDDVLSHLLTAERDGVRMTDDEIYSHVRLLYAVGATTTSDAMSSLMRLLLTEPGLYERARLDPASRPLIVREALRYEPPVATLPRLAPNGGAVAGIEVPRGALVLAALAAANRDPEVFAHPDQFDIDRDENATISFGFGSKYCPGIHLARQQLLVALEAVIERLPALRLVEADEPTGAILRSVRHLRVRWDR